MQIFVNFLARFQEILDFERSFKILDSFLKPLKDGLKADKSETRKALI